SNFVMALNGIQDRATTPNVIAPNTLISFFSGPYTPTGVGNPPTPGTIDGAGGGFNVGGGGANIGGTSDQVPFDWQPISGDFDIAVRMAGLSQTDPYSQAGIMAREDLTVSSRFAAVLATPSINAAYFESRAIVAGSTANSGNLRVNFPSMWLRLRRSG